MNLRSPGALALGFAALVLTAALVWRATQAEPQARLAGALPSAAELDTLSRYLRPVGAAPVLDDYQVWLPAEGPPRTAPAPVAVPRPTLPPPRVSAILITGARRVALVDGRRVAPGDRLDGGRVIVAIEPDRVVVREPDGREHTVPVTSAVREAIP